MKNLFKLLVIGGLFAFISGTMASCVSDPDEYTGPPVLEVGAPQVNSAISVDIPLTPKALTLTSVGYKVVEVVDGEKPTAPASAILLYRSGKRLEGCPKAIKLTPSDGLSRNKKFVVYIAATISDDEFYHDGEILSVEFSTPDNYADDDVVVLNRTNEGVDVFVAIPEHVRAEGRCIKWGVTNIAMLEYNGNKSIPEMLHSCDSTYPASLFHNDTTLNINHYNAYRRTANGDIGYYAFKGYNPDGSVSWEEVDENDPRVDTGEAEPIQYYYHFQPGEPLVLMMSEVYYTDCSEYFSDDHHNVNNCDKKHPTIDYGWGPGWYWYPFDFDAYKEAVGGDREDGELPMPMPGVGGGGNKPNVNPDKFWHEGAWWRKLELRLPAPGKFAGSVNVKVSNLSPDGGKITFTPDENTFAYLMGIYEDTNEYGQGYRDIVAGHLDGDPSLMQWFTTSEMAPYFGIFPYYKSEGTLELKLEEYFYTLTPKMKYHIVVNSVGSKIVDGDYAIDISAQNYQHITFEIPDYTLDAPELEVTSYESNSPWRVKFNIKNPKYETLPVEKVVWVANYARDFDVYMGAFGYTYTDMVMMNDGVTNLDASALRQVNSKSGYDLEFDVRQNSTFRLAAMGWNSESRPSDPDAEGAKAWADATSIEEPAAEPLNLDKLNALKGDWTATATIKTIDYNTGQAHPSTKSWKVTIGELDSNKTLTAADLEYLAGFGVTEAAAKEYLKEFNTMSAEYNESVRRQNRILCLGWDVSGMRETSTAAPWDLFMMSDYNASQVDYLFYDFGPKWFLQTDAEGNIFIPVNYDRIPQVVSWYNGLDHYLCGGNYEAAIANYIDQNDIESVQSVGIPVEISADGNKVTLKSYAITNKKDNTKVDLYPTLLYSDGNGLYFYDPYVVSEVVLTKGWTEPATPAKLSTARNSINTVGKRVTNSENFKAPTKPHSRTLFAPGTKKVKAKVITNKFPSIKETREGMESLNKRQPIVRK